MRIDKRIHLTYFIFCQKYFHNYSFIHINKCGGTSIEKALGIPKLHDFAVDRKKLLGRERWKDIFTFSIVRHPYSRVVSHYKYRAKTQQLGFKNNEKIRLNSWISKSYGDQDPKYYDNRIMFSPSYDWVSDKNGIIVDNIYKLENLNEAWPEICKKLNREGLSIGIKNATSFSSEEMAIEQLSNESINIINDIFCNDFDHFGYKRF